MGGITKEKMKLSIALEVHKDTGVSRGTYDKVAGPPCQIVLENQSVIVRAHPSQHRHAKFEWTQSGHCGPEEMKNDVHSVT